MCLQRCTNERRPDTVLLNPPGKSDLAAELRGEAYLYTVTGAYYIRVRTRV